MTTSEPAVVDLDAVVVGAGFSGLYMLYKLRNLGLRVRLVEAADEIGGTWHWNRYPGARCDIESLDYSYSFSTELEQEWVWEEKFATQPEILRYINHVADRFDLRRDIVLQTRVQSAVFDEQRNRWRIHTDNAGELDAQFCVMATGCLSQWKVPDIPGIDTFEGRMFTTGQWPRDGVDFSGERVGIIGTGSSGVQAIPLIAEQARHLTVFQRTPAFTLPARNQLLDPARVRDRKARYPENRVAARASVYGVEFPAPAVSALDVDPEERQRIYEQTYDAGSLVALVLSYTDILIDKEANDTAADFIRDHIRNTVADQATADALCPEYPFAVKRPCLDTNYYAAYNRDNVTLVNLRETPLVRVTARGIETDSSSYELDAIVLATGFDAITGALEAIDIRGRDNRSLKETWANGARAYLGVAVAGFPNLFTVTGPGSPSVLSNMLISLEQHVEWIADAIESVRAGGFVTVEATEEAVETWTTHVAQVGGMTLYAGADSWFTGANVPGKPRVLLPYCGGVGVFRQACDAVAQKGYEGFVLKAADRAAAGVQA